MIQHEPQTSPDINLIWNWFEFQLALVNDSRVSVLRQFDKQQGATTKTVRAFERRFIGLIRSEVESFFEDQRGQLELLTMFELLATTEAILRIDFNARVATRRKDGLSRRFRQMNKSRPDKIRLDEDILTAMKDEGTNASAIAAFRGVLRLRHWLAHGRHWHPKLGRGYTPNDVFDISRALIDSISVV